MLNAKSELVSSITNPFNFINHLLDNIYSSITIFTRFRELQKSYMTAQSQISELKLHNKYLDSHLKSVKKKRDTFSELVKELKNELERERQARYMVEKCHMEKVDRLLFEDDMKEREIDELKNQNRELERKLCKIKEDLNHYKEKLKAKTDYYRKKFNRSPSQILFDNINSNYNRYDSDSKSTDFNEGSDYDAYTSPSLCNVDFEADTQSEDIFADDKSEDSDSNNNANKKSKLELDSEDEDDEDDNNNNLNTPGISAIPKDSPYYELFNKTEEKESPEDLEYEEDNNEYVEISKVSKK